MKKKLFWDIFNRYLILILFSIMLLSSFLYFSLKDFFYNQAETDLLETLKIVINVFRTCPGTDNAAIWKLCTSLATDTRTRVTYILPDGVVAGDSEEDPALMDNHGTRPEVYKAMQGQQGSSIRYSHTLSRNMLYLALPLYTGEQAAGKKNLTAVLRVSRLIRNLESQLIPINLKTLLAGIVILIGTILVSFFIARKIDMPVLKLQEAARQYAAGNFTVKTYIDKPEEIKTLSTTMNLMAEQLALRISIIDNQKNKLEAILAHMVEPVILLNGDLVIKELNKSAAALFALDPAHALGYSLIEVIRNIELYDFSRQALTSGAFSETEIRISTEKTIHLQVHATSLFSTGREPAGLLLVMNDITRLMQLESIRKDFVANVSHELKTPVTAIQGFVEALCDGAMADKKKAPAFLEIIRKQTGRLDMIINDLLSLSRLEASENRTIEKTVVRVADLVHNARENCLPEAEKKQITIHITGDPALTLQAEHTLLEQALTNLLDNALKYSKAGSTVEISYRESRETCGFAEILVKDRGCGIPRRDLPHIFERFYRVDKARSRAIGGTGLGLSIVKHIALVHGGTIKAESTPEQGSTFTLCLPVSDAR